MRSKPEIMRSISSVIKERADKAVATLIVIEQFLAR